LQSLFNENCLRCKAFYWKEERVQVQNSKKYTTCCNNGKISFTFLEPPNALMQNLFTGSSDAAKLFRKKTRKFNTALAFASCLFNEPTLPSRGPPAVIVQGNIMHRIGSLEPQPNRVAAFMQTYFYSAADDSANPYFQLTLAEVRCFTLA
jgi:hypothetical protein